MNFIYLNNRVKKYFNPLLPGNSLVKNIPILLTLRSALLVFLLIFIFIPGRGQLLLSGQIRTRPEFRDGQGSPLSKGSPPAFFTSQRSRLNLVYQSSQLKFGLSLQDVRVWGQDGSTINRTTSADNNGLLLHQAWVELPLLDSSVRNKSLQIKLGRQELVYDDSRLLGNLDWLQQARSHDAALLKYTTPQWILHLAVAYNQNKEYNSGTVYNPTPAGNYPANTNGGSMYKSFELLYAARRLYHGTISWLFFRDQFNKFLPDTLASVPGKSFFPGVWSRNTTGIFYHQVLRGVQLTLSADYQFGDNSNGQKLSAELLSLRFLMPLSPRLLAGPGVDFSSGGTSGTTTHLFDPLYGSPHKFFGLMDYYYAGSPFGKGGLVDYYVKSELHYSKKISFHFELHQFLSAIALPQPDPGDPNTRNLGAEMDLTAHFKISHTVSLEGGYGHYWGTPLLVSAAVKNVNNARLSSNWAYLMLNITPVFIHSK
ncbi:MAG: alginate export family protein [Chitinophagaceae bacterium]